MTERRFFTESTASTVPEEHHKVSGRRRLMKVAAVAGLAASAALTASAYGASTPVHAVESVATQPVIGPARGATVDVSVNCSSDKNLKVKKDGKTVPMPQRVIIDGGQRTNAIFDTDVQVFYSAPGKSYASQTFFGYVRNRVTVDEAQYHGGIGRAENYNGLPLPKHEPMGYSFVHQELPRGGELFNIVAGPDNDDQLEVFCDNGITLPDISALPTLTYTVEYAKQGDGPVVPGVGQLALHQ